MERILSLIDRATRVAGASKLCVRASAVDLIGYLKVAVQLWVIVVLTAAIALLNLLRLRPLKSKALQALRAMVKKVESSTRARFHGEHPPTFRVVRCLRVVVYWSTLTAMLPFLSIVFALSWAFDAKAGISRALDSANRFTDLHHLPRIWLLGEFMLPKRIRDHRYEPAIVHMHEDYCRAIGDAFSAREKRFIRACLVVRTVTLLGACFYDMFGQLAFGLAASLLPREIRESIKRLLRIN
jgi:hypothetical protein